MMKIREFSKVSHNNLFKKLFLGLIIIGYNLTINAQFQQEELTRGVVAIKSNSSAIYVGWRLLGDESDTLGFNLYRITDGTSAVKVNAEIIKGSTNHLDTAANLSSVNQYFVVPVQNNIELTPSDTVGIWEQNYKSIPLQLPSGGTTPDGAYTYTANDVSVGDLNGDGEYEIILKWDPSNSKDNSQKGYTGNVLLDAYKLDGTFLWRIDLGINIRAGAHYTQFLVYDFDGDGKAELACKTAPGTKDGSGNYLSIGPAESADHEADYRNGNGYILQGPEYLTVFNGLDGKELTTTNYVPARGSVSAWGDDYGNRVDRFLAAVAYLNGETPSLVMCRGYYTRTVLAAWDFKDGELTQRWIFDTDVSYSSYAGQGNHGISVADVDDDGNDEIIYGAMAVDDDGTGLWNTGLHHGDAMHVSDIIPERKGLEKWGIHEGDGPGSALLDAATGEILWLTANADVGRGVSADLVPEHFGMECWGGTDGLKTCFNTKAGNGPSSTNHVVWWDGDLSRELLNDVSIAKYNGGILLEVEDCSSNNSTKSNPCLQADLLGDWREEVIWRTSDNSFLRIYTTTDPTEYKIKTLMHDHVYRMGIAWQNVAYNQPPHTGFFLGSGMYTPDSLRAPSIPTGISINTSPESIQLSWNKNLESDLSGYNIYRSESTEGPFVKINNAPVLITDYSDSSIDLDVLYSYLITAIDTFSNESSFSDPVYGAATLKPDWPIGIKASSGDTKSFIYWEQHTNTAVVGYNIYRSLNAEGDYQQVNKEGIISELYYTDSLLINGATYYYVVTAIDNENRESFFSEKVAVIPSNKIILQAEDALLNKIPIEAEHAGYNGSGYVNFNSTGSIVKFIGFYAHDDGKYYLKFRYALGNSDRSGSLTVNNNTYLLTMKGTTTWNNFVYDSIEVELFAGFNNTITFTSTGKDFGNLDEICLGIRTGNLPPMTHESFTMQVINKKFSISIAPNPFKETTTITLKSEINTYVNIEIINLLGMKVFVYTSNQLANGETIINWEGNDLNGNKVKSGMYICKVIINNTPVGAERILIVN